MKNVTPLRLGVFGAVWFVGGLAWFVFCFNHGRIPNSPAITIDQYAPVLPRLILLLGLLMLICSGIWAIAAWFRNKRGRS